MHYPILKVGSLKVSFLPVLKNIRGGRLAIKMFRLVAKIRVVSHFCAFPSKVRIPHLCFQFLIWFNTVYFDN